MRKERRIGNENGPVEQEEPLYSLFSLFDTFNKPK